MSAGRPALLPTRTIRQPRRKLVETDRVWVSRNPDSLSPDLAFQFCPRAGFLRVWLPTAMALEVLDFSISPLPRMTIEQVCPFTHWMVFWRGPRAPSPLPIPVVAGGRTSCKRVSLLVVIGTGTENESQGIRVPLAASDVCPHLVVTVQVSSTGVSSHFLNFMLVGS